MGKIEDIRARMRGHQAGTNVHTEAALEVALAEQEGAAQTAEETADAKLMAKKAKSDATGQMISGGIEAVSGPIGGIAKGESGGGLIGMMKKGKGGDVAGGELTKGQQKRAANKASRQAKREERRGGAPKVKGGLLAPLFTGGKVNTRGEWTEKGMKAQNAAKPPPVTITKDPLYNVGKATPGVQNIIAINEIGKKPISADSPTKSDIKEINKADDKSKERSVPTMGSNRNAIFKSGSSEATYSDKTRKYARIFMLPENQKRTELSKMSPDERADYNKLTTG